MGRWCKLQNVLLSKNHKNARNPKVYSFLWKDHVQYCKYCYLILPGDPEFIWIWPFLLFAWCCFPHSRPYLKCFLVIYLGATLVFLGPSHFLCFTFFSKTIIQILDFLHSYNFVGSNMRWWNTELRAMFN